MSDDRIADDLKRTEALIEGALKPDSEWRLLDPEEVIQDGDEFQSGSSWDPAFSAIGQSVSTSGLTVRRRVSTPATDKDSSGQTFGEAWNQLRERVEKAEALQREASAALTWANEMLADYRTKLQQAEREREMAELCLREIYMALGNSDPADGEGVSREDVVRAVEEAKKERDEARLSLRLSLAEMALREKGRDQLRAENERFKAELLDLKNAEQEWEGILASEKLGGNIVKEAEARGVLIGLRFAQQALAKGEKE